MTRFRAIQSKGSIIDGHEQASYDRGDVVAVDL